MKDKLKEIIYNLYDLIYEFESKSFDTKASLIILNYDTYQKIATYDIVGDYFCFRNKTIVGIPYIIKCDSKIDMQVK